jgi:flagellar hook-associated protein 2
MTAVTFTGLSSGIDTASLVSQLVSAERAPVAVIASRQSDLGTQKSIVGSLSSALAALGTAVRGMDIASELQPRAAASSDSHVTVATSSGAAPTVHDVRVLELARGQITGSRTFTSAAAGVLGAGSLSITVGGTTKSITYGATDSLADIASKITNSGIAATASVLFDGTKYQLMVAANATGTAAAPTFVDGGDSLGLSSLANIKVPANDASATIDGVSVKRGTNVFDDVIPGLTLTLVSPHAVADPNASVRVTQDTGALTTKLKSFVSAYNAINAALHVQLDYTGSTKGTNTLFGDATLRTLQGAFGSLMSSEYGATATGNGTTLGAIGLSRDKTGGLTLDETKLASALSANPDAVSNLFVTSGFATAATKLTDAYSRAGDGILAGKIASLTSRSADLQKRADRINSRADALKAQLETQFTRLETAMSTLKTQSSFIASAFG